MATFDLPTFTRILLSELLFYDEEYGAIGSLSLVDPDAAEERYIASFMPDDGTLLIEEATEWESDYPTDEDDQAAYALAINSTEHGRFDDPDEAAAVLLGLADEHDLLPSFMLLFESDEL